MAIQFLPMARPGEGVSSLLDFSPLAAGLRNYTAGNDAATQMQNRRDIGAAYTTGGANAAAQVANKAGEIDAAMQYTQAGKQDKDRQIKLLGAGAQAAKNEKDPNRRAVIWNAMIKRAGVNPQDLDPDELDPMTGPEIFLGLAGQAKDPLDVQLKEAQIKKALADASDAGGSYGKTGLIFTDPNTNEQYSVQFASDGTKRIEKLVAPGGSNLVRERGVTRVGSEMVNQTTGETVRDVSNALVNEKIAEGQGKDIAEGRSKFPAVQRAFNASLVDDQKGARSLAKIERLAGPWTTGFAGSVGKWIAGSPQSDLAIALRNIEADLAFGALQTMRDNSPTGGALGAISERELELLKAQVVAIDQAQSYPEFKAALDEIKRIKGEYASLRRQAYEQDLAKYGPEAMKGVSQGGQTGGAAPQQGAPRGASDMADDEILKELGF